MIIKRIIAVVTVILVIGAIVLLRNKPRPMPKNTPAQEIKK